MIKRDDIRQLKDIDKINGTGLQGYINASFQDMVYVFGSPHQWYTGRDKVQVEWRFELPGGAVATIYDWKEARQPQDVTIWHVGGINNAVADYMGDYFAAVLNQKNEQ
jgi:hypothetical protein